MTTTSKFFSGRLEFFDGATFEHVLPVAPIVYYQDFVGAGYETIPAAGSAVAGGDFVAKIVLTAGTPTVAGVSKAIGGQVACALTATSEKQDAVLYWDDNLGLDATKALNFECRVLLSVVPNAAGVQAVWGLGSVWIDGPNNNTSFLRFGATANGAVLIEAFDGVTTTSIATGVTVGTTDWHIYRIDANNLTDVKFFIDGVQVSTTGLVNFAATGTLAVLQPYLACYKPGGTGVATLTIDFVRAWMNRQ
jgi:hypothetical protein